MKKYFWIVLLLALPSVVFAQAPGCPYIAGSNDTTTCGTSSVTLHADALATGLTTSYTVSSIPFAPPYPVTSGTVFSLGTDDIWSSSPITIPFNFCFFGSSYNQIWVGSNGVLTFTNPGSTYCPWSFTASVPSSSLIMNSVFGVYQDIDPSVCGTIRYAVLGSYPCRTFVFNFNQVCHFSCTSLTTTTQMVLYEGTNVIEVYVYNKPLCSSWNNGNSLIGIQNSTGTLGYAPPGRNTGQWTATNEAWRFTPSGPPNYTISWFANGALLGYGTTMTVAPTVTTDYIAVVTYDNCDFTQYIDRDTITVSIGVSDIQLIATDTTICSGDNTTISATGATLYTWSSGQTTSDVTVSPTTNTTYIVTGTDATGCEDVDTIDIFVDPLPLVTASVSPVGICSGDSAFVSSTGAISYLWNSTVVDTSVFAVSPAATSTYSVTGTDVNGCTNTAQTTLTVYDTPQIALNVTPSSGCEDLQVQFSAAVNPSAATYEWLFGDGSGSSSASPVHVFPNPGTYDVSLKVSSVDGCENSITENSFVEVYPLPVSNFLADNYSVTMDDPTINFSDLSTIPFTWMWNFGDYGSPTNYTNSSDPSHTFSGPGDYIVWQTVYTDHGCSDSSFAIVHVDLNIAFYIPNAFSPYTPDGVNDVFRPYGIGVALTDGSYSMRIFDRWGQMVFESENIENGWDGKFNGDFVVPGVYNYIIDVQYGDGLWHIFSGKVTIMH
ncbi:MAG: hypothetical protein CVU11_02065 [Bacteroidetes bacterium HGW-Bacteroidetes-6]|jgi:gliding motility-associated-like protein|nr:MAG: hypothetical protein CVU11_02065 [Bacteroidetes bacterium HGW-Bacteroidetes-6]